MRTLRKGMSGEDVRYLQYILKAQYNQNISTDGSFGPATEASVKAVQKQLGLEGDGSVGPLTQRVIGLSDYIVHIYNKEDVQFAGTPYSNQRTSQYPLYTLKQWAGITKADKVYNLSLFNMISKNSKGQTHDAYGVIKGRTLTYLKADGVDCGYGGSSVRVAVDDRNICAGQFIAIDKGKALNVPGARRAINANGILKDGRYFQVQSVARVSPNELITYMMKNYQVQTMLIQDYGGSTGFYDARVDCLIAGEKEGRDGRPVASVAIIRNAKAQNPIMSAQVCPCCGQEIKNG